MMGTTTSTIPLARLQSRLKKQCLLVTDPANVFYLTGFRGISPEERGATVLVTPRKVHLFVPKMYQTYGAGLASVRSRTVTLNVSEREGVLTSFRRRIPQGATVLFEAGNLTVAEHARIKSKLSVPLRKSGNMLEDIRIRKTAAELRVIRQAVSLTDQTFGRLVSYLKRTDYQRLTELEVAEKIWQIGRSLGGQGLSFKPIVAAGAGSAEPHYATGQRKLKRGQPLLLDFGISYGGYHGDLTRCLYLGKAPTDFRQRYAQVLEANRRGIEACRPGQTAAAVYAAAVYAAAADYFKDLGVEGQFLHALGHGVGVEVHEAPRFAPKQATKLEPGMVVTIEPGLYFAGQFGIRIEDYLVITERGAEALSSSPKNLVEI